MCPFFCGVWDNSKGYEALSVVTHNGGGYTSNKPVPAGIEPGTDNGEYWAYTYRAGGEASAIDWDNVISTAILPNTLHNWDLFRVCILLYMWRYIIKEEI